MKLKDFIEFNPNLNNMYIKQVYNEKASIGTDKVIILSERPLHILDKEEKEYLSNVIKPFIDCVVFILKDYYLDFEYIAIEYKYKGACAEVTLSYFDKGTKFKGMELQKEYTLEELELL